jgi:hypothetical protein
MPGSPTAAPASRPASPGDDVRAEARQFRLLWRASVRRLLDNIAASRDADPSAFVLWATTLALTLPLLFSMRRVMVYQFSSRLPQADVEAMLRRDQLFFIVYSMLAAGLLAVVLWDALFPDRTDQEILGVLPVRPRTAALARLAAAVTLCLASAAAIAVPPAVLYSVAMTTFTGAVAFPRLLAGHVAATVGVAAFVFFVLMSARGIIALAGGQRLADRLALLLQVAAIVSIVEGLAFLPGMLARARAAGGGPVADALPPLWFFATYAWIGGLDAVDWRDALFGPAATAGVFVLLLVLAVAPADRMGRRALLSAGRGRESRAGALVRAVVVRAARSGPVRALFGFSISSMFRSRRHLLLLSTRLGLAIAILLFGLVVVSRPGSVGPPRGFWLAAPLVLSYFLLIGLRSCLAIPVDLDANWVFRLVEPPVAAIRRAIRLVLLAAGLAPVMLAFAVGTFSAWPAGVALRSLALVAVTAAAVAEFLIRGWTHVPFATAHAPDSGGIRSGWPRHVAAVIALGVLLPTAFVPLSRSPRGTLIYVTVVALAALAVRWHNDRDLRLRAPTFESTDEDALTLQLSEAGH